MTGLLADLPQPGYPADYLLARLAARRERWREMREGQTGWHALAVEFRWLYGQLHRGLRRELAPLFLYFELRPLFLFLRALASDVGEAGKEVLVATLLADELKRALLRERELTAAVRLIGRHWRPAVDLGHLYASGGLAAVEQGMTRQVLAAGAQSSAALRGFWSAVIDLENIMALGKRQRWQAKRPFGYCAGGSIFRRRFGQAEQGRATLPSPMAAMVERATQAGEWPLEEVLVARVQQQLRQAERPPATAVAAYMWDAYAATRRLAMAQPREARA